MNLKEIKKMLEENDYLLDYETKAEDVEVEEEKDNFTEEDFEQACNELGLVDSSKLRSEEDDFFTRLDAF